MTARSSKKRKWNQGVVLAILIVVLVIACIGLLIVAGLDVNAGIAAYAVIITVASIVMYFRGRLNYEFANNQNLRNARLLNENSELIRENNSLRREYRTDYNTLSDEIQTLEKKRSFAERSVNVYRKRSMEADEIFERLKKDYPEVEAVIVAYKAEIEEAQQAAKKVSEEIKESISIYRDCDSVEELQRACSLYMGLSTKEKKWLPAKKKMVHELKELVEKAREERPDKYMSENASVTATEIFETDESEKGGLSRLEDVAAETSESMEDVSIPEENSGAQEETVDVSYN